MSRPLRCPGCLRPLPRIPYLASAFWSPCPPMPANDAKPPPEHSRAWQQWADGWRPCCSQPCMLRAWRYYHRWAKLPREQQEAETALRLLAAVE